MDTLADCPIAYSALGYHRKCWARDFHEEIIESITADVRMYARAKVSVFSLASHWQILIFNEFSLPGCFALIGGGAWVGTQQHYEENLSKGE